MSWKDRPEGGAWFAIWLIRSIGRYGGRAFARLFLYPITLYVLCRRGPERRASRAWLTRALGRPATLWDVARHIHTFACTILDRVFLLGERLKRFEVEVHGLAQLHAQLDRGQGVLLFGSHLGSFEVLRVLARERPDAKLRVVLDVGHNPALTQLLDALNPDVAATVIDAGQPGPSLMLAIQDAVSQGAMVALLVDRVPPGEPFEIAEFLGRPAPLPTAPWLIAAVLGAPVVLDVGHNPALTQLLDALNPDVAATVIDAGQPGPSLMLAIQDAVSQGAMVALLVDRVPPGEPFESAEFLGRPAPLPTAPWLIAAVLGAPVVLAFGLYRGGNRYELHFETFSEGLRIPRAQRKAALAALIRRYAARLEHFARRAPYNWFNFYDFWAHDDGRTSSPPRALDAGGAGHPADPGHAGLRRAG